MLLMQHYDQHAFGPDVVLIKMQAGFYHTAQHILSVQEVASCHPTCICVCVAAWGTGRGPMGQCSGHSVCLSTSGKPIDELDDVFLFKAGLGLLYIVSNRSWRH